ncbi:dentin sialophosphoprotein-like isoform X1 [Canna indica]|uniref:Dentin sialophosphoprotein-like isoform X1 n=1 Tax=Canna indica TaxID=4628 RepID=A0AAQ3KVJ0_9LILI|nr:dentin sialophosphoprotein-like isoform X1 [Canna indica]
MATDHPSPLPQPSTAAFTVFVDSNLGTHLAMAVSPVDTVADIKKKIKMEHQLCFPGIGEVTVQALKVKRRGAFYHLSDTMLVRSAFDGSKGTWFLHVDVADTSASKYEGQAAGHFVDSSRDCQFLLKSRLDLEEDLPLSGNNISINNRFNVQEEQYESADHIDLAKSKPGNCQVETIIETSIGQLAAGNHKYDASTHFDHLERTEVDKDKQLQKSDGMEKAAAIMPVISNSDPLVDRVEVITKKELHEYGDSIRVPIERNDVEDNSYFIRANSEHVFLESKTGTEAAAASVEKLVVDHRTLSHDGGSLYNKETSELEEVPPEVHVDTHLGGLSYSEELSNKLPDGDSSFLEHPIDEKKKKRKRRRSSKSEQTDAAMPLNNHQQILSPSSKEHVEHGPELAKSDAIGLVTEIGEGNNEETMVNNQKDLVKRSGDENAQASENMAGGDTAGVDTSSKKNVVPDIGSEYMTKGSNHLTSMENNGKTVAAEIREVSFNDNHDAVAPTIKEAVPLAEVDPQIPTNFHSKRKSIKRSAKNVLARNDPAHSSDFANEENSRVQLGTSEEYDKRTSKEALIHDNTVKLDTENVSAGNIGRSHHKRRRKSEKAGSANFQSISCEPVQSIQNLTDKENLQEKLDDQELGTNEELDKRNNKDDHSHDDTAKLDTENISTGTLRRSHHKRRRKSEKAESANVQSISCEPVQSLQDLTNTKDLQVKLDEKEQHKLVVTAENSAAPASGFPSKPNDAKLHRKKKRSSKIEHEIEGHETTMQDLSHSLARQVAEGRTKETMNNHHNEQSKESNSLANHGEAGPGGSANVDLAIPTSTNGKNTHRRKRKSSKLDLLYNTSDTHDTIHPSENHTTEVNFEKAFPTTNNLGGASNGDALPKETEQNTSPENDSNKPLTGLFADLSNRDEHHSAKSDNHGVLGGTLSNTSENLGKELSPKRVHKGTAESAEANKYKGLPNADNNKINFIDVFRPSAVQHEPVISAYEPPSAEIEPKKQHKSKRKRKSSKHDTSHDLANPSESVKHNTSKSEHLPSDPGNQDSVDPTGKPSRGFNDTKADNESAKRTTDYSMNDGANLFDMMFSQNSHDSSLSKVKEKIQGNKPDTFHQLSVSQDEQSKHAYRSNEQSKHAVQSQYKATSDDSHEDMLPNPVASSDSTEDSPEQASKYKLAVRKGKGPSIFDSTGESSEEHDFRKRKATKTAASGGSSSPSDSDEDLDNMQKIGHKSAAYGDEDERTDGEDITLSQSSIMSRKGLPLGTILRSTSSYKKAKILASQSQAEGSESQPVDLVPETQPEFE